MILTARVWVSQHNHRTRQERRRWQSKLRKSLKRKRRKRRSLRRRILTLMMTLLTKILLTPLQKRIVIQIRWLRKSHLVYPLHLKLQEHLKATLQILLNRSQLKIYLRWWDPFHKLNMSNLPLLTSCNLLNPLKLTQHNHNRTLLNHYLVLQLLFSNSQALISLVILACHNQASSNNNNLKCYKLSKTIKMLLGSWETKFNLNCSSSLQDLALTNLLNSNNKFLPS